MMRVILSLLALSLAFAEDALNKSVLQREFADTKERVGLVVGGTGDVEGCRSPDKSTICDGFQVCCLDGSCANYPSECSGDTFPPDLNAFAMYGDDDVQVAGFPIPGALAIESKSRTNIFAGEFSGDKLPFEPGFYQLILPTTMRLGETPTETVAIVEDADGNNVGQFPTILKVTPSGPAPLDCDIGWDSGCLYILCCHNGKCVDATICFLTT